MKLCYLIIMATTNNFISLMTVIETNKMYTSVVSEHYNIIYLFYVFWGNGGQRKSLSTCCLMLSTNVSALQSSKSERMQKTYLFSVPHFLVLECLYILLYLFYL